MRSLWIGGFAAAELDAGGGDAPAPDPAPMPIASMTAMAATVSRVISGSLRDGHGRLRLSARRAAADPARRHLDHEGAAAGECVRLPGDRRAAQAVAPATRAH